MRTLLLLVSLLSYHSVTSQTANDTINDQVWKVFSLAYQTHNSALFQSIHSNDLVRVSGNGKRIYTAESYLERCKDSFLRRKEEGQKVKISFRFLERFNDGNMSSEQGIYRLEIEKKDGTTNSYFGRFHVLLRRASGQWRIFMDYDINPNNEIGLPQYLNANPIDLE